jgi:hypothetical protein
MGKGSGLVAGLVARIRAYPIVATLGALFTGVVFGPGSFWNYLDHKISSRNLDFQQMNMESLLQDKLTETQEKILKEARVYVKARDKYFPAQYKLNEERTELQGDFVFARTRVARLIQDYNLTEAQFSILQARQPAWFDVGSIVRPPAPQDLQAHSTDDPSTVTLTWKNVDDPLLADVRAGLKTIYLQYGQGWTETASVTVTVPYPSESLPSTEATISTGNDGTP